MPKIMYRGGTRRSCEKYAWDVKWCGASCIL